ncbi:diacylglycerol/lipid kinase family protein [Adlercreutzia mucosicola]|uniref:diacylglycerol/lipid kinase family protein n=1 Tax=Adlercreutzia mucosicola TaxID=580026 RepID=UPI002B25468A|nr:diacylglycerol kinase family protein [Adlercreutzia mucosicola]MEB1813615.1 diacylglycerol kinase family lipid kinase [Adlercreutzia mucosicola]
MALDPSCGRIALIANPAAQNGRGAWAAVEAASLLRARVGDEGFQLLLTERPRHATALAASLDPSVGTVVALGGDGLISEVAAGLMERPVDERPALGVIPVGSGNDYAASLGVPTSIGRAIDCVLVGRTAVVDVGRVNGRYFVETLSFGLDAAIALDTVERRVRTGRTGTRLYLESAVDQLFRHLSIYDFTARLTGGDAAAARTVSAAAYLLAVQIGPTYGGHFRICPGAELDDGLLDLCYATPHLGPWKALAVLLAAKGGRHTGNRHIHLDRASRLVLDFAEEPPGQIDGEKIEGTHFEIDCIPRSLTVIVGK